MIIPSKHDGYVKGVRRVFDSGGGSQPSGVQTVDLPDWAKGYAQDTLARGQALTQTPYQSYQGERTAQFTPLQQQAFQGAGNMGPNSATTQATQGALGMQYNPYQTGQFTGQTAQNYMNPYMQNVVDVQQREAARMSDIAGTYQQAQATQSGAFGGARDAIMRAERERNLATQQGAIQAQGLQQAYSQGQGQFNTENQLAEQSRQYGAGLGLQGLQTALTGGNQQFTQGMASLGMQNQFGTQQQQQVQNILGQQYSDFQNQQKYPYQQLDFMSNLVRGSPMGTTSTLYQAPPSTASQLIGAGTALYGASKMKKGGVVKKKPAGLAELACSKM